MKTNKKSKETKIAGIKLTPDHSEQFINWFPGHMNKAIKEIKGKLKLVDIILEVCDARAPQLTRNFYLEEKLGNKKKILIFNKENLADPKITKLWKEYLSELNIDHIFLNITDKSATQKLLLLIQKSCSHLTKAQQSSLIIGLPNTGKSTLINRLVNKNVAKTANRPGQTRTQQLIKVNDNLSLLDTPGIMPPKIEHQEDGLKLAALNSIPSHIVSQEDSAIFLLKYLIKNYPENLRSKYEIKELSGDILEILDQIGQRRKCLLKKGQIDYQRVYDILLSEFQEGKLGSISLEAPPLND